jgi:single-strand DNA-binding protein
MKSIVIAGNIGKDAEVRNAGDSKVTSWSVAVDDGFGQNKRTIWFDCSMWGVRGEKLAPHITKGGKICVSGEFSTREHNGTTYPTIRVSDVTLQGGGERSGQGDGGQRGGHDQSGGAPDQYERNKLPREGAPAGGRFDDDDEIPF